MRMISWFGCQLIFLIKGSNTDFEAGVALILSQVRHIVCTTSEAVCKIVRKVVQNLTEDPCIHIIEHVQ